MRDQLSLPLLIFSASFFIVSIYSLLSNPFVNEKSDLIEIIGQLSSHSIKNGIKGNKFLSLKIISENERISVKSYHTRNVSKLTEINDQLISLNSIRVLVDKGNVIERPIPFIWSLEQNGKVLMSFDDGMKSHRSSRNLDYIFLFCGVVCLLTVGYRRLNLNLSR